MSRKDGYDAIVIGAGIIGLSCAYYLTKAGKRVLVLERGQVGSGTSGACDEMVLLQSKTPGLTDRWPL
ncbi:MAG: FAD-binding oxidoreductase [Synergistota bacterium]|nr:FAD-binding oxidoreductase [Synergistota bacterium]